jgi:DNA (cytosine-5)-methyltransferase 1
MFPDDHTKLDNVTASRRAFFMGNALVVGVVERLGNALIASIQGQHAEERRVEEEALLQ